jgi:GntR family transcriptional regulator
MDFEIIKHSPVPVYLQLKDIIFNDIKNGKYTEGQQLPTVKELSAQSGVSIRTAYLALEELVKSGSCFKRPKKGIFVQKV